MIQAKLAQLGARLADVPLGDSIAACDSAEQVLPVSECYLEALKYFGSAVVFDNGAKFWSDERSPLNGADGYQSLEMLFGIGGGTNSVERKAVQYAGELPISFIPIGECAGGNLICVNDNGAVYLWDHESQRNEEAWRVADSIDEFIRRLEPDDSPIGNTDGIVESESFLDF